MKHLIKHLLASNLKGIAGRSLLNCHCVGLHSIMLLESPEKTIRLYIALENHELYKNSIYNPEQSIAFHPHHCDLTLHCVKGAIVNVQAVEHHMVDPNDRGRMYKKYLYSSQITNDQLDFEYLGEARLKHIGDQVIGAGESLFMKASSIHTVFASPGTVNAWLVYEGKEDPDYIPWAWSLVNLDTPKSMDLYKPMTEKEVLYLLKLAGLHEG